MNEFFLLRNRCSEIVRGCCLGKKFRFCSFSTNCLINYGVKLFLDFFCRNIFQGSGLEEWLEDHQSGNQKVISTDLNS